MGIESRSWGQPSPRSVTVSFGQRFASSDQFDGVFQQGMDLVERTAAYLDGAGRKEAKSLKSAVALTYSTESMRLTTRLLDLASWLLIRRSLKEGEITEDEAARKRARLKLRTSGRPSHIANFGDLPESLRGLIEESFALGDRISRLDTALAPATENSEAPAVNPVAAQIAQLRAAFTEAVR